jgi:hypothetical protein
MPNEREHPIEGFFEAVSNESGVNPKLDYQPLDIATRMPVQLNPPGFGVRSFSRVRSRQRSLDLESDDGLNNLEYLKGSGAFASFMDNLTTLVGALIAIGIVVLVVYNLS